MVSSSTIEIQLESEDSDRSVPQRDIVVSIIISESTASLLELDAPNLQDLLSDDSSTSTFTLKNFPFFKSDRSLDRPSGESLKQLFAKSRYKEFDYINVDEVYFARNFDSNSSSVEDFNGKLERLKLRFY